ncbi:MAG: hypothetical protein ACKOKE_07315 [Actinomycetota bacterium]
MRYEIERDDRHVASLVWEGPGQVAVCAADPADQPRFDRFFGEQVVYLSTDLGFGGALGEGGLAARRRDGNPWEFERQVHAFARTLGATARRVTTGPVEEVSAR